VDLIRNALSWIFPVFSQALNLRARARDYQWALHLVLLGLILAGLAFLNHALDLRTYLPTAPRVVQQAWLPLLFLLIYALSWLGWWLYRLLGPEEAVSLFPDLDDAWDEAMRVLRQKQFSLNRVPVFLVLGGTQGGDEAFFQAAASGGGALAGQAYAPVRSDAPIRVFAGRSCAFVTCASASLLAEQSRMLSSAAGGGQEPDEEPVGRVDGGGDEGGDYNSIGLGTLAPGAEMMAIVRAAQQGNLSDDDKTRLGMNPNPRTRSTMVRARPKLLELPGKVNRLQQRLRHVCSLLSRERWPNCPINGILLLIPLKGTDDTIQANDTGLVCEQELATVRAGLKLRCPVLALVCDMEQATGFADFVQRIPAEQRKNRLGLSHPWLPALPPHQLPQVLVAEVEWIIQGVLISWVYRLFEGSLREQTAGDPYAANASLFQFICEVQERKEPLARILASFAANQESFYYGGCYLAGTGTAQAEQAFVPGVLAKLVEGQDFVSWTPDAIAEDAGFRRRVQLGYGGLVAFTGAVVAAVWLLWSRQR